MLKIGISCSRRKDAEDIAQVVRLIAAREGLECLIYHVREKIPETGEGNVLEAGKSFESGQEDVWNKCLEDLLKEGNGHSCVILSWDEREQAFARARMLWNREPALIVLYVAHSTEDVFAALQLPFFHMVRIFDLEQDLKVAFQKIGRLKSPLSEKVGFTWGGKVMHIFRKDILYLESEHHDIRLHTGGEILPVSENLSQCEQKLKSLGFVRIHRSFLVNMYHIRCLEKGNVLLDNGERLYISRQRYPEVKFQFENYIRHLDFL